VVRVRRTSDSQLLHNIAEGLGLGYLNENRAVWALGALDDIERLIQDYLDQPVGQILSKKFIDVLKFRYILPIVRKSRNIKGEAKELLKERIAFLGTYLVKHTILFVQDINTGFEVKICYPVYYSEIGCVIFGNLETGQV